jgi:hypothetical protein
VTWAVWLLIPVVATVLAAVGSWLRHRPARRPDAAQAMREHGEFLDALVQPARSKDRGPQAPTGD